MLDGRAGYPREPATKSRQRQRTPHGASGACPQCPPRSGEASAALRDASTLGAGLHQRCQQKGHFDDGCCVRADQSRLAAAPFAVMQGGAALSVILSIDARERRRTLRELLALNISAGECDNDAVPWQRRTLRRPGARAPDAMLRAGWLIGAALRGTCWAARSIMMPARPSENSANLFCRTVSSATRL